MVNAQYISNEELKKLTIVQLKRYKSLLKMSRQVYLLAGTPRRIITLDFINNELKRRRKH